MFKSLLKTYHKKLNIRNEPSQMIAVIQGTTH